MPDAGTGAMLLEAARALRPRILTERDRIESSRRLPENLARELARNFPKRRGRGKRRRSRRGAAGAPGAGAATALNGAAPHGQPLPSGSVESKTVDRPATDESAALS